MVPAFVVVVDELRAVGAANDKTAATAVRKVRIVMVMTLRGQETKPND